MKKLSIIFLTVVLAACGTPTTSTPAPTLTSVDMYYSPALQPWADRLSSCAAKNPLAAIYIHPTYATDIKFQENDIELAYGVTIAQDNTTYQSQVGWEQITVIVNQANPITELSGEELEQIYSGAESNWQSTHEPIQVWTFLPNDPARVVFEQAALPASNLTSESRLAVDPSVMFEAVSEDSNSIGYLPQSFLKTLNSSELTSAKILELPASLETELRQPVVAVTNGEPKGLLRGLLVCLQDSVP